LFIDFENLGSELENNNYNTIKYILKACQDNISPLAVSLRRRLIELELHLLSSRLVIESQELLEVKLNLSVFKRVSR
jgi:hypothetical protein